MTEQPDKIYWTKKKWEEYIAREQKKWDEILASDGMGSDVGYEDDPNRVLGFTTGVKSEEEDIAEDEGEDSFQSCPLKLGKDIGADDEGTQFRIEQPYERRTEDMAFERIEHPESGD